MKSICVVLSDKVFTNSRRALRRFGKNTTGAVLVEFAFVLPLVLLFLFGSIAWGYTLSVGDTMFDAARQAARELAVGTSTESGAQASALDLLSIWPATFEVDAQDITSTGTDDVLVVVTTTNVFAAMLPFVPLPENLRAEVTMRKE